MKKVLTMVAICAAASLASATIYIPGGQFDSDPGWSQAAGGGAGGAAAPCAYGEDCGGQQFTECGTMCPVQCGSLPGMMCNMMCYNGFQCPNGQVTAACPRDPVRMFISC